MEVKEGGGILKLFFFFIIFLQSKFLFYWVKYNVYTSFWGLQCTSIDDKNYYDCDNLFSFHGTQQRFDKIQSMSFFMFFDLILNIWGMYEMARNKLNEFYRNFYFFQSFLLRKKRFFELHNSILGCKVSSRNAFASLHLNLVLFA